MYLQLKYVTQTLPDYKAIARTTGRDAFWCKGVMNGLSIPVGIAREFVRELATCDPIYKKAYLSIGERMTLGEEVRAWMKAYGVTRKEFGRLCGHSGPWVGKVLMGEYIDPLASQAAVRLINKLNPQNKSLMQRLISASSKKRSNKHMYPFRDSWCLFIEKVMHEEGLSCADVERICDKATGWLHPRLSGREVGSAIMMRDLEDIIPERHMRPYRTHCVNRLKRFSPERLETWSESSSLLFNLDDDKMKDVLKQLRFDLRS